MKLNRIEKNRNLLVLGFDNGKTASYDFSSTKMLGVSGKEVQVKTFVGYFAKDTEPELRADAGYRLVKRMLDELVGCDLYNVRRILTQTEQWFSYLDLLDERLLNGWGYGRFLYGTKLPKGYIAWVRKENKRINSDTLDEYRNYKVATTLPGNAEENVKIINLLANYFSFNDIADYPRELQIALIKSIKVDLKNYTIPRDTYMLRSYIVNTPNAAQYYDSNRGLEYNRHLFEELKDKERNEAILKNEAIIFDLENLDLGEYQIVVPHAMEDFTNEGKQQNNCVGSYYHDTIAAGENLIYFLRKKENLTKSYVTCRYSVRCEKSVETRLINNCSYYNDDLFEKIDTVIKNLLTK